MPAKYLLSAWSLPMILKYLASATKSTGLITRPRIFEKQDT